MSGPHFIDETNDSECFGANCDGHCEGEPRQYCPREWGGDDLAVDPLPKVTK